MIELYDKKAVEAIPLGSWVLSISGSEFWVENDRGQLLNNIIKRLLEKVPHETQAAASRLLRLVSVTNDLHAEVRRWGEELGRPQFTTILGDAVTGAKTLLWGSGKLDSTYAIIVLFDWVAAGMLQSDDFKTNDQNFEGYFVHELAHIHDSYLNLLYFGESPEILNDDWIGIRQAIAEAAWGEFFAESIAYPYFLKPCFKRELTLTLTLFQDALWDIERAVLEYEYNREISNIWPLSTSRISNIFNQFGRLLGFIYTASLAGNDYVSELIKKINEISPRWGTIVRHLNQHLRQIITQKERNISTFSDLAEVVEDGFKACGLFPLQDHRGLRLDISTTIEFPICL